MNDQTTKLMEQLAQKLGTTSEYLWSILLRQAPIDATLTLCYLIFTLLFGIALYTVHRRLMEEKKEGGYTETRYSKYEESAIIPMVIATVCLLLMCVGAIFVFPNMINGYFNPEYWALQQILDAMKPSK